MRCLTAVLLLFFLINVKPAAAGGIKAPHSNSNKITTFDCPLIDDSQVIIYPSACNAADGNITGIKAGGNVTGTAAFTWYASDNTVVGNTADLLNVVAGTYTLSLKDDSKCTAVKKKYIVGTRNSLVLDTSAVKITPSECSANTGAVTDIKCQNAVKYQWVDAGRTPLATTPDLTNVPSGAYSLTITSTTGCTTTLTYLVPSTTAFPTISKVDTTVGTCGVSPGTITVTINPNPSDPVYTYSVVDATGAPDYDAGGQPIAGTVVYSPDGPTVISIPIGTPDSYNSVILTDKDYCSEVIGRYKLPEVVFKIVTEGVFVRDDACGRHTGQIVNLKLVGATPPTRPLPQQYYWTDSLGNVVGRFPDLINVGKGTYHVVVKDIHGCSDAATFTVGDSTAEALPPAINGATLCLPGSVTLSVINPDGKYKYRLYDSTKTPMTENTYGIFQQALTKTTKFYVTTVDKLCESDFTPVTVIVVAPGVIIPNTFTPNNDGVNDYWTLPHIDDFPGAEVSIFSRDGQLVYHSINYSRPFDGKLNGQLLPSGVYYYVVDLKQPECLGKISGSLTIIR